MELAGRDASDPGPLESGSAKPSGSGIHREAVDPCVYWVRTNPEKSSLTATDTNEFEGFGWQTSWVSQCLPT